MSSVADWVSLAVPAAAALSGVALSLWAAARQTRARTAAEAAARSWEHRRQVYVEFLRGLNRNYHGAERRGWVGDPGPPEDDLYPLYHLLDELELFGTPDIHAAGRKALDALAGCVHNDGEQDQASVAAFLKLARRDLHVPD